MEDLGGMNMLACTASFRIIKSTGETVSIMDKLYSVYWIRAGRSKCHAYIPVEDKILEYDCVKSSNIYVTRDYLTGSKQDFALRVENARVIKEEYFEEPQTLEVKCCGQLRKTRKKASDTFTPCTLKLKDEGNIDSFFVLLTATGKNANILRNLPDKTKLSIRARIFDRLYMSGKELNVIGISAVELVSNES